MESVWYESVEVLPPSDLAPSGKFHQTLEVVGSSGHGKVHFHPGCGGHLLDKAQLQEHLPTRNEALRPCWSC